MRVGWLHDQPGYEGGAELTMSEFRAAAPPEVEVVECPAGEVVEGLDTYVIGNAMTYAPQELGDARVVRYHHDLSRAPFDHVLPEHARHTFTSPAHYDRLPWRVKGACEVVPPALNLEPYRAVASVTEREGACCVGRMAYGKGLERLGEQNINIDVYSTVPFQSWGKVRYMGAARDVAATLAGYRRFVFLPAAFEPFGRAVVEAWAAGCDLLVNQNVGSLHYLRHDPVALDTAAVDFWEWVLSD